MTGVSPSNVVKCHAQDIRSAEKQLAYSTAPADRTETITALDNYSGYE